VSAAGSPAAFIVTGGLGSIGSACVRALAPSAAHVAVFDWQKEEEGEAWIAKNELKNVSYQRIDVTKIDEIKTACQKVLEVVPEGSLAGGIHCAGIAPGRKWTNKLAESAEVDPWTRSGRLRTRTFKKCSTSTRTEPLRPTHA
jgi:NAD(P)-dependent dehydrogenase (short-subunit alcohol dehydrogenase family)